MADISQVSDADLLSSLPPSPQVFAAQYGTVAQDVGQQLGVDPKLVLGQWGQETGWGKSIIPGTNNLGNVKDPSGQGPTATDNATGSNDSYQAFNNPEDFGRAYASLVQNRYPGAVGAGSDVSKFTKGLAGYAQDPSYAGHVAAAAKMVPDLPSAPPANGGGSNAQPDISQLSDADLLASLPPSATQNTAQTQYGTVQQQGQPPQPLPVYGAPTAAPVAPPVQAPQTDRQKAAAAVNEALEGGPLNQFTHGIASGAANLVGGGAQLAAHGIGAGLNALNFPNAGAAVSNAGDATAQFLNQGTPQSIPGQVGQMVGTAALPLPGRGLVSGAVGGAAMGAAQPVLNPQNYWQQKALQAGTGAAVGGVAGGLGKVIGGATLAPAQQAMVDAGVTLTPGQALGGAAKGIENTMGKFPFSAPFINSAKSAAVDQVNRALYQRALAPIGVTLPDAVKTGSEGVDFVNNSIGNVYKQIEPLVQFAPDTGFAKTLGSIQKDLAQKSPASIPQFNNILDNQIYQKLQNGLMNGSQWGDTRSFISGVARNQRMGAPTPDGISLANSLDDLNDAINHQVFLNSPPSVQPALQKANQAWANYKQIEAAAGTQGAIDNGNVFTPAQFSGAVRKSSTASQRSTTSGLNADFATQAKNVVVPPPAAGAGGHGLTFGNLLGMQAMESIPHFMYDPHSAMVELGGLAAAGAGTGAMFGPSYGTQAGRQAMLAILAKRPDLMRQLGVGVGSLAPQIGGAAVNGQNLPQ